MALEAVRTRGREGASAEEIARELRARGHGFESATKPFVEARLHKRARQGACRYDAARDRFFVEEISG